MSREVRDRLVELLNEQRDCGELQLPGDVTREKLLNSDTLARALTIDRSTAKAKPALRAEPEKQIETKSQEKMIKRKEAAVQVPDDAPAKPEKNWQTLEEMQSEICDCTRCSLADSRNKFVFGVGNPGADLVVVGEAPGAEEDKQGVPFVGRAGDLLTNMLAALGFSRDDIYICNILKCRPPNNRDPNAGEVAQCSPYLRAQLDILRPKLILAVGRIAGKTLLQRETTLKAMRGEVHRVFDVPLRVTYHPAALLRNPHWKRPAWEDLQALYQHYLELGGKPGSLPTKL